MRLIAYCWFVITTFASSAVAHEGDHYDYSGRSKATITTKGDKRIIDANGLPDHKPGQFPNRGNPNSISEQQYHFEMPLKPQAADEPHAAASLPVRRRAQWRRLRSRHRRSLETRRQDRQPPGPDTRMEPGMDRSRIWNYDGMGRMNLGIDENHAHVQPTGAYHYHGLPTGLIARCKKSKAKTDAPHRLRRRWLPDCTPSYGHEKADDATSPLKKLNRATT